MNRDEKTERIKELARQQNSVILAHNYQMPEIQDIADYCGDSLELSRLAGETSADVIIFCGVDFMAETAKIISPEKTVILPVRNATCPMANMISASQLREYKKNHLGVPVVSYVNTTAAVKAESNICCTSSNAVKIVSSLEADKVIFTPDRNLAAYVESKTGKEILKWDGYCPIHDSISVEDVFQKKSEYPDALFMAHPECRAEVLELADYVVSTGQMFDAAASSDSKDFIIGTEKGIAYPLSRRFPEKNFVPVSQGAVCINMKKMSLDVVLLALENMEPEIELPPAVIEGASAALNRMLELS